MARDEPAVLRLTDPAREVLGDAERLELGLDDLARQEVALHEAAEAPPDAVLARRDDGGVRDRDAERVPEERGDGEPVGEPADHRRLGGSAHGAEPRGTRL